MIHQVVPCCFETQITRDVGACTPHNPQICMVFKIEFGAMLNKILVLRYLAYIVGNFLFMFLEEGGGGGGGYDGGVVVSLEAHTGILASTAGNCFVTLVIIW